MGSLQGYAITYKSLGAGSFDYSFEVDNEFFSHFEGSEITAGNCGVQVQLQRGEAMLEILVKIDGEVVVACDRCLEDCSVPIEYEGTLIVKFSNEIEEYDGEILWLSPAESEVDLSQYIYESIVLSLPYQRVHATGECNEEMISKFASISHKELAALEAQAGNEAVGAEELEGDKGEGDDNEGEGETHGLGAADLAKLMALKAKMESE